MIDTNRLATDAAYWDEVAGTATHYCPSNKQFYDCRLHACCIPRPRSEWVDGLPPVGSECELLRGDDWVPVKITGKGERVTVFRKLQSTMEHITEADADEFRPIPTKAQRERKDLALSLQNAIEAATGDAFDDTDALVVANDLLAKGWTKP